MSLSWTRAVLLAMANVRPHFPKTITLFLNSIYIVQKDFVQTVRAVEDILGVGSEPTSFDNIVAIIQKAAKIGKYSNEVKSVLVDSVPVLFKMLLKYGPYGSPGMIQCPRKAGPLTTKYVYFCSRLS